MNIFNLCLSQDLDPEEKWKDLLSLLKKHNQDYPITMVFASEKTMGLFPQHFSMVDEDGMLFFCQVANIVDDEILLLGEKGNGMIKLI